MSATVYFSSLHTGKNHKSPLDKISRLLDCVDVESLCTPRDLVAVKVHFGELGNTAFIRPIYLRPVISRIKSAGANPYLTDTNTLYVGMRTNSVDHLHNAAMNGFNYSTLQVPVIIADGLRGENAVNVPVEGSTLGSVSLAADIVNADSMVCMTHFKGHEVSGFGGAIKNLSMGCASRGGKMQMHAVTRPEVKEGKCTSCGRCVSQCQVSAISLSGTNAKAVIDEACVGCARCIAVCPENAIANNWDATTEQTQIRMAEYAKGVSDSLEGKIVYVNIMTDISPGCDCYPGNDAPVTGDIGFAASTDPVALDKACLDMVATSNKDVDPFAERYAYVDSSIQLSHAEKLGLGSMTYTLVTVD